MLCAMLVLLQDVMGEDEGLLSNGHSTLTEIRTK